MTAVGPDDQAPPPLPALSLERQLAEAGRYYVCGVIENGPNGPERYADSFTADSPRQAEDQARAEVHGMVAAGRHGNLWVAGVYQLNLGPDGELLDPPLLAVDSYAKYVDPDLTDEVL